MSEGTLHKGIARVLQGYYTGSCGLEGLRVSLRNFRRRDSSKCLLLDFIAKATASLGFSGIQFVQAPCYKGSRSTELRRDMEAEWLSLYLKNLRYGGFLRVYSGRTLKRSAPNEMLFKGC